MKKLYRIMNSGIKAGFVNLIDSKILPNDVFGKIHCCTFSNLYDWIFTLENTSGKFGLDLYREDLFVAEVYVEDSDIFEVHEDAKYLDQAVEKYCKIEDIDSLRGLKDIRLDVNQILDVQYFKLDGGELGHEILMETSNMDDLCWGYGEDQIEITFDFDEWYEDTKREVSLSDIVSDLDIKSDIFPSIFDVQCIFDYCIGFKNRGNDFDADLISMLDSEGDPFSSRDIKMYLKYTRLDADRSISRNHVIFEKLDSNIKLDHHGKLAMLHSAVNLWNSDMSTDEVFDQLVELFWSLPKL